MIRLTVLYNLKPEVDEDEFLEWRLTDHQKANSSMSGVVHTDFSLNNLAWPEKTKPRYRFMTTAEWPNMDLFKEVFYEPQFQAELRSGVEKMLDDHVFLIGEILANHSEKT
ncbi:MAG: hypothetical protein CL398_08590 [Acidiferrobacteraceae bacterium]|nr:hypothetical protein [Acidiferrobacteraceae bacterium]